MRTKTTLPITEARKKIFELAKKLQNPKVEYYTLTERGIPKIVILSATKFEKIIQVQVQAQKKEQDLSSEKDVPYASKISPGAILSDFHRPNRKAGGKMDRLYIKADEKILVLRDESQVVYSSQSAIDRINNEKELVKAQLYVELIEKYDYPLESIKLGRYVRLGNSESKRYIETDIIAGNPDQKGSLLFAVSAFESYEKNLELKMRELFDLATALGENGEKISHLVYFSRSYQKNSLKEKIRTVDFEKFSTFESWKKSKFPAEKKIPKYAGANSQGSKNDKWEAWRETGETK